MTVVRAMLHATTLLAASFFAAAAPARAQIAVGGGPVLAYTVTDSALRGPAAFTVGVVTIQVTNRGRRTHLLQLLKILDARRTIAEARDSISRHDAPPSWTQLRQGVGPVEPGQTISVTVKLDQGGDYLLLDPLAPSGGRSNARNGVVAPLTGTGVMRRGLANMPATAGLMIANRFRFGNLFRTGDTWTQSESRDRNTELRPGLQTIRIESFVAGAHSIVIARGGTEVMRQYVDWREGRRATPPAGLVGGVAGVFFQSRAFVQLRLAGGGYIIFCPDRDRTGMAGYETGEFTQFVVR